MAKKSLTDLLHEEVKKSSQQDNETVQENPDSELIKQDNQAVEIPMNTQSNSSTKRSTPTKAELEATITELRAALKEAQHQEETFSDLKNDLEEAYRKEGSLEQKITDLQAELQAQKKLVQKLEKELEKLGPLKTELEQAKKAALQLAQANEKLTQGTSTQPKQGTSTQPKKEPVADESKGHTLAKYQPPVRPVQKEADKPDDFAKTSWLL